MALGAVGPIMFWAQITPAVTAFLVGCAIIVCAGIWDDFRGLNYQAKLMAQVGAAMFLVLYGGVVIKNAGSLLPDGVLITDWLGTILTVFVIVGVTNAINLADGLDGLAAGISLLIFLFISYLAYLVGNMAVAIMALTLAGTLFGFLRFNTYPALLFMGDTGSMLLGFSAGALSIMLTQGSTPLSPLLPLVLLGFPILDIMAVTTQRISNGHSPFEADKTHFHHRLLRLGLFQAEAVFTIYMVQTMLILFAYFFRFHSEWLLLLSYVLFSALVVGTFTVADRTGWKLKRFHLIDRVIKGKLKVLRGKWLAIRIAFPALYIGLPILFVILSVLPRSVPSYISLLSASAAAMLVLAAIFRREWLGRIFMPCLYIYIPLLVYCGDLDGAAWLTGRLAFMHNLSFVGLAFFAMATLKFTRRQDGFHITPMDFIVVVLAFALLALPREILPDEEMKHVIPKTLTLFFGFEVLVGELRGNVGFLAWTTIGALLFVAMRGAVGI